MLQHHEVGSTAPTGPRLAIDRERPPNAADVDRSRVMKEACCKLCASLGFVASMSRLRVPYTRGCTRRAGAPEFAVEACRVRARTWLQHGAVESLRNYSPP